MKKTHIWECPRLCLWLIFAAMLCSCAVKHKEGSMQKKMAANTGYPLWRVEVLIMPTRWLGRIPGDNLDAVLQYYTIKKVWFSGESQVLELSFRANSPEQANRLLEQLLATGMVEQVYMTKE